MEGLANAYNAISWADTVPFLLAITALYWGKKWIDLRFDRKKAQIVYKVKIVGDSHISVDHAHIDEIEHNHIEGDINTHAKTW
tara:strand:+ start:187 stop:435 length:249 start_codon:yes stop_codon:yes gene_type:complete